MTLLFQLMRESVDYAGLFPPAGLPLAEVVTNYATYLRCEERSMLGRLIIPAMKLTEFEGLSRDLLATESDSTTWRISALVPPIENQNGSLDTSKFVAALDAIASFNQQQRSQGKAAAIVDALEVKVTTTESTAATIERMPAGVSSFLENSDAANPERLIEQIAQVNDDKEIFAKIRTGFVTPDLIPSPSDVARFIAACAKHKVGFKATAGLHHPMRGKYQLTYEDDAPVGTLFGFLNVFVATMFAFEHGLSEKSLIDILVNEDASQFGLESQELTWGSHRVSSDRVRELRKRGIVSFGSCSFSEPAAELQNIPNISHASVFSS